jgi:hypothetical protein
VPVCSKHNDIGQFQSFCHVSALTFFTHPIAHHCHASGYLEGFLRDNLNNCILPRVRPKDVRRCLLLGVGRDDTSHIVHRIASRHHASSQAGLESGTCFGASWDWNVQHMQFFFFSFGRTTTSINDCRPMLISAKAQFLES